MDDYPDDRNPLPPMLAVDLPSDPTLRRSDTLSSSRSGKIDLIDRKLHSPVGVRHDNNAFVRMKSGEECFQYLEERQGTTVRRRGEVTDRHRISARQQLTHDAWRERSVTKPR